MKVDPLELRREDISDLSKGQDIERLFRSLNGFGASANQALKSGLTFADNMQAFVKEIDITMGSDAHTLAATAPLTGTVTYRKDRDGVVHLSGDITKNAAANGAALCTLPAGFRPGAQVYAAASASGPVAASAGVATSGAANLYFAGAPTNVFLDGVTFPASDRRPDINSGFPVNFTNELAGKQKPLGCWVWQAWDMTDKRNVPVCAGPLAWELSSKGDLIVVRDIANLAHERKYKIRLVVVAG